jgi:hypothetical protein
LARLNEWRKKVKAPIPTEPNPEFDPRAETTAIAAVLDGKSPKKNRNRK